MVNIECERNQIHTQICCSPLWRIELLDLPVLLRLISLLFFHFNTICRKVVLLVKNVCVQSCISVPLRSRAQCDMGALEVTFSRRVVFCGLLLTN